MTTPSTQRLTEVRAKNGSLSVQVTGEDGQSKALHSLYDPEKEARLLVDGYSYGGEGHIVVLGLGLGYHVLELAQRFPGAELVIVEPSTEIYGKACACGVLDSLRGRAASIVGKSPSETLREITRRQGIPRRYLEQALQQLVRQGILIGVRGPRGGYRLARERRRISVGDVVRVVRKMETSDNPIEDPTGSELGRLVVRPLWGDLQDEIVKKLDSITIDDLCTKANEAGVVSEGRQNLDFSI